MIWHTINIMVLSLKDTELQEGLQRRARLKIHGHYLVKKHTHTTINERFRPIFRYSNYNMIGLNC